MSTKVNIAVNWHILCKRWPISLYLIDQAEISNIEVNFGIIYSKSKVCIVQQLCIQNL